MTTGAFKNKSGFFSSETVEPRAVPNYSIFGISQAFADGRYQRLSEKGVANGYAPLDGTGKIDPSFLPPSGGAYIPPTYATGTVLGNNTGGTSTPVAITYATLKGLLQINVGDITGLGAGATLAVGAGAPGNLVTQSQLPNLSSYITSQTGSTIPGRIVIWGNTSGTQVNQLGYSISPMGTRFMQLTDPSAVRYLQINSNNTISYLTAAQLLAAIGAGSGSGSGDVLGANASILGSLAIYTTTNGKGIGQGPVPGNSITRNVGTGAGDVAAGNHTHTPQSIGANTVAVNNTGAAGPIVGISYSAFKTLLAINAGDITGLGSAALLNTGGAPGNVALNSSLPVVTGFVTGPASPTIAGRLATWTDTTGRLAGQAPFSYTSLGQNFMAAAPPGAIRYIRINSDNSLSFLDAATFLTSIGGGTGGGTGNVVGQAASVENEIALFTGTTGKIIKRGNIVGAAAYLNVGTTTGTVAAGDHTHPGGFATTPRYGLEVFARKTGQGHYNLEDVYGVNYINGSMKLSELYSLAVAQNKFAKMFAWYTSVGGGQNNAWVMNTYHGNAAAIEAILQGNEQTPLGTARIGSNNTIEWPRGIYLINVSVTYDGNKIYGRGTNTAFTGADNTVLALDRAGWQGTNGTLRDIFFPSTYGGNTGSSWTEGTNIDNFRLEGGSSYRWYDGVTTDSGIRTWDMGECSKIGKIYAIGFNGDGISTERGTPTYIDQVSAFSNALGGIGIYGGSLGTVNINMLSGDDNTCMLRVRPGSGRPAGGTINVGEIKSESGKRNPVKGQIILDAADAASIGASMNVNIQAVWAAVDVKYVDALFAVKGFTTGGNASRVTVGSISGYNYATLLHDVANSKRWSSPGDYSYTGFTWNGGGGGNLTFNSTADATAYPGMTQGVVNAVSRLGMRLPGDPAYNYATGTPLYDISGGGIANGPANSSRANVFAGMVPSIVQTGTTAQGYGRIIDYDLQAILVGVTLDWSVQSGPASVNNVTGVLTANPGVLVDTTAVIRCSFGTHIIDFPITVTP